MRSGSWNLFLEFLIYLFYMHFLHRKYYFINLIQKNIFKSQDKMKIRPFFCIFSIEFFRNKYTFSGKNHFFRNKSTFSGISDFSGKSMNYEKSRYMEKVTFSGYFCRSFFSNWNNFFNVKTKKGNIQVYIFFNLCIMRLLVYHSLLIQQALFVHNNNKKIEKLHENLWRNVNYWCQKSSFFSRIVSCFKN